ncbi:recombinase family protein [Bacillus tropicus]
MPIKSVAIYLRKSRKEDSLTDAEALVNHRDLLTGIAKVNGWDFVVFEEVASSMDTDNRPKLQALLANLSYYDAVLVMDIDRLSRNRYDSARIMEAFKRTDTKIVTADGRITDLNDETEEVLTGMQEVFSNYEYNQIKKRLQRGKVASAKQGNWVSGRVPLGYNYNRETKRLQIDSVEAVVVKSIYDLYCISMKSYREIALELNQSGYRGKRGKCFTAKSIQRILENQVYLGHTNQYEVFTENTHEPLVTADVFEVAQQIKARRSVVGSRAKEGRHSLSGLTYCGYCGHSRPIQVRGDIRNVKTCSYRDLLTGKTCSNSQVSYTEVFQGVMDSLEPYRLSIHRKIEELRRSSDSHLNSKEAELELLRNNLKEIDKKIRKIAVMVLEDDSFTETFKDLREELLSEKDHITKKITKLTNQTVSDQVDTYEKFTGVLDMIIQEYRGWEEKDLNERLSSVILKVEIFNRKGTDSEPRIKIHWR